MILNKFSPAFFTFTEQFSPTVAFNNQLYLELLNPKIIWNFGDGLISEVLNPVHTYTENGLYKVECTVELFGLEFQYSHMISVGNILKANAGSDLILQLQNTNFKTSVLLNGNQSQLPNVSNLEIQWRWIEQNKVVSNKLSTSLKLQTGNYTFELSIFDLVSKKHSTDQVKVEIKDHPSVLFHKIHFYKPTTTFADSEVKEHTDLWILTKNDEDEWENYLKSDKMRLQYLSVDNLHDPDSDLLQEKNTPPKGSKPKNNNAAWNVGDIAAIRDSSRTNWFLRNPENTSYINKGDENSYWHVDLQNQEAREFIQNRVAQWSAENNYDGVFFDNGNTSFRRATAQFCPTLQYGLTDDETYMNALIRHLDETKIKLAEKMLQPIVGLNLQMALGNTSSYKPEERFRKIVEHLDYVLIEFCFLGNDGGYKALNNFQRDLDKIEFSLSLGKWTIAVLPLDLNSVFTDSIEYGKMFYSLASCMLVTGNRFGIRCGGQEDYDKQIDPPLYNMFLNLGSPLERYKKVGDLFVREFEKATVSVNPVTQEASIIFKLYNVSNKPYVTQSWNDSLKIEQNFSKQIWATCPKGETLNFETAGLPEGLQINSNGLIQGTVNSVGLFNPSVKVSNSSGTIEMKWKMEVVE